ncbi:hypothetical protein BH11BAC3_BH11BAC3_12960 [soil metagenome]
MKANDIIIAGVAGTTAFTFFSFIASKIFNEKFIEPELLGKMLVRAKPSLEKQTALFTGWLIHYLIGISFTAVYKKFLVAENIKPSAQNGAVTGAVSGCFASLIWDAAFKIHPLPPRKRNFSYYLQLTIGHAIFGTTVFMVLQHMKRQQDGRAIL